MLSPILFVQLFDEDNLLDAGDILGCSSHRFVFKTYWSMWSRNRSGGQFSIDMRSRIILCGTAMAILPQTAVLSRRANHHQSLSWVAYSCDAQWMFKAFRTVSGCLLSASSGHHVSDSIHMIARHWILQETMVSVWAVWVNNKVETASGRRRSWVNRLRWLLQCLEFRPTNWCPWKFCCIQDENDAIFWNYTLDCPCFTNIE